MCAGAFLICHLLCRLPSPGCPFELVWFWGNQLLACVQRVCAIAVTFTTAAHATDNSYDHLTNSTAEYVVWSVGTMNRTTQPTHAASCWLLPSTAVTAVITCHNLLTLPGTPKDSNNNCARHARSQTKGSTDFCDLVSNPPAQLVPPSTLPPNLVACMEEEEGAQAVEARKNGKIQKYVNL